MKKCPFFNLCGGCEYDFTNNDYHKEKLSKLPNIDKLESPIWVAPGKRIRADFCFAPGKFGFYARGSKDIISISECANLKNEINKIIPDLKTMPWCGTGSCMVTLCENGLDISVTSSVKYVTTEFRESIKKLNIIRFVWNENILIEKQKPLIRFGDNLIEYPSNAFLQPISSSDSELRKLVLQYAYGAKKVADLFCGLGNFTFDLHADGFDVVGTGVKRDLFKKPLTVDMLSKYDCVVMDPPRAGAMEQSKNIAKSNVSKVIYVSCNPQTFLRDKKFLEQGGYTLTKIIPFDQFVGSSHWELFSVFEK